MNKLIIAEKPMLARDIARVMCGTEKIPAKAREYTVVACAGHLLELKEPHEINKNYEMWRLEDLPISFKPWKKKISEGKNKLVNIIRQELKNCDSVINAGDPDDEGQLIVDEVLEYLGYEGLVERVYINDSIDKNIKRAFDNLKDNKDCYLQGKSALARQLADMCFGINESRLASIKTKKGLSIGRVQTPTLGLVVKRDREIKNHVVKEFYELLSKYKDSDNNKHNFKFIPNQSFLDDEEHVYDVEKLKGVFEKLPSSFKAKSDVKIKKEYSPLPFNLTKLQSEMTKRHGFSAKHTLDITQTLRDKYKAITYNRTDCQYLSEEHFKQAEDVMKCVLNNFSDLKNDEIDLKLHHSAFNDKNVTAHHGIIPQEIKIDVSKMTNDESKIYRAICLSYVRLFLPPCEVEVSKTIKNIDEGKLECVYKRVIKQGWKETKENNDSMWLSGDNEFEKIEGQNFGEALVKKETAPPRAYTEGTLIADMSSIAKYVKDKKIKEILKRKDEDKKGEHGGIGTTATRADIIEKLKKRKFIEKQGKKIVSTKLGQNFYDLIPDDIRSADITAYWWLLQEDIAQGRRDPYYIMDSVVENFKKHKDTAYEECVLNGVENRPIAKCPVCGSDVVFRGKTIQCISNKYKKDGNTWTLDTGCGFKMFSNVAGKKLTNTQVKGLCEGKQIYIKGLKSKSDKTFDCDLKLKSKPESNGFYSTQFLFK